MTVAAAGEAARRDGCSDRDRARQPPKGEAVWEDPIVRAGGAAGHRYAWVENGGGNGGARVARQLPEGGGGLGRTGGEMTGHTGDDAGAATAFAGEGAGEVGGGACGGAGTHDRAQRKRVRELGAAELA